MLERDTNGALALRLGFRQIEGFKEEFAHQIVNARGYGFASVETLIQRTELPKRVLMVLAEADAFRSFHLDRREALWKIRRLSDAAPLPLFEERRAVPESIAPLPIMPLSEHVIADYQTIRLSLKAYPTQSPVPAFRIRKRS